MKKFLLVVFSFLMATTVLAQGGEPKSITLTDAERRLVEQNSDFAFNLFRKTRKEVNLVISPLSITYALGMLNNGAAGQTQQEINEVLGFGEAGADAINQFCKKMLTESGKLDEKTTVEIANTIFVNSHYGYELKEPFVQKASDYYDAQPETRDFYDGVTRDVINQWASDHTQGMIKEVLKAGEFNEDVVSYLLNALYFKGAWTTKFNPDNTKYEPFNGGATVPMMHIDEFTEEGSFDYTENDLYQAVKLPYGNGAYLMTVFLPRPGKTIGDVLDQMDGHNWQSWNGHEKAVDLKLPRFEIKSDVDLRPVMTALGMPAAFDPYLADFREFCNVPTYIGLMKQVARIELDEQGAEAAAVTIIGECATGLPVGTKFHADRPFLYVISEKSTGSIFFIGQYMGEDTSDITPTLNDKGEITYDNNIYDLQGRKMNIRSASQLGSFKNIIAKKGLYIAGGKKIVVN